MILDTEAYQNENLLRRQSMKLAAFVVISFAAGALWAQTPSAAEAPLSEDEIVSAMRHASSERMAEIVKRCGIDFQPAEKYLEGLRGAGAKKVLVEALRAASQTKQPEGGNAPIRARFDATGGEVSMPVPIRKPEPPYSEQGRQAKLVGSIALWIVIDTDGKVADAIETSQPLGKGMDELAIKTVQNWRFEPARRNGVPVAVRSLVEITYRLS